MRLFKDLNDVWYNIKSVNKPILIYGMGDGANKILKIMKEKNIEIQGIFASDEFVRGQLFSGYKVIKYSEAVDQFGDFAIILAFGVFTDELLKRMEDLSKKHNFFAPDVPLFGDGVFDDEYINKNENKIKSVYELMEDEQSKLTFDSILKFKYTGDISYLIQCTTGREEVFNNIIKLSKDEIYMDLGAYDGDTVEEFIKLTNCKYNKIIAVEPATKNFEKLIQQTQGIDGISYLNLGIYNKQSQLNFSGKSGRNSAINENGKNIVNVDSIDNILNGDPATYIKMDIEGAERDGLIGGAATLKAYKPKLAVSAYHCTYDIFDLPLLIKDLNKDYKIYLRHHPYIPAWETNIYAI